MIATKKVKAIFWPWLLILAWEKFYDIGARFWNFFYRGLDRRERWPGRNYGKKKVESGIKVIIIQKRKKGLKK